MNKKSRILLIVAAALLLFAAVSICITEISAKKIPHRYASAEEGRERMLSHTAYYDGFTQNDIDYRLQKRGATLDELLEASTAEVKDFNLIEKYLIDRRIAKMARTLKKNGYTIPLSDEIVYIKTDMEVEGGHSGYTHGNEVYLNSINIAFSFLSVGSNDYFGHLLWHELFHYLTRNNPDFRKDMYSLIHFTVADSDFELPESLRDMYFNNPDVEHHNSYATFTINGSKTDCFLLVICTQDYPEDGAPYGFPTETVLVPIDGSDTYYTPDQASDFDEVFGTNNDYVVDPEECMADNFADAMQFGIEGKDGQGYPNPEIIQGIIDILCKEH